MKGIRIDYDTRERGEITVRFFEDDQRTPSRNFLSNKEIRAVLDKKAAPGSGRMGTMHMIILGSTMMWNEYYPLSDSVIARALRRKGVARLLEYRVIQHIKQMHPELNHIFHVSANDLRLKQFQRIGIFPTPESYPQLEYSPEELLQKLRKKIGEDTARHRKRARRWQWVKNIWPKMRGKVPH